MKITESSISTRIIAGLFSLVIFIMAIRGVVGMPEFIAHTRENAQVEGRSWIGSIVIVSVILLLFCAITLWISTFAILAIRAPVGRLRFESVSFFDKFIGICAILVFILAIAVVGITWITSGPNEDIRHGLLTAIITPSTLFGTFWLFGVVRKMFGPIQQNHPANKPHHATTGSGGVCDDLR